MPRPAPTAWNTPLTQVPPRNVGHGFITSEETRWRAFVRRRLRSLTVALALVLAVAGVALGVAVGLMLSELRQGDRADARASALEQQITRLEARIHQVERHSRPR